MLLCIPNLLPSVTEHHKLPESPNKALFLIYHVTSDTRPSPFQSVCNIEKWELVAWGRGYIIIALQLEWSLGALHDTLALLESSLFLVVTPMIIMTDLSVLPLAPVPIASHKAGELAQGQVIPFMSVVFVEVESTNS